MTHGIRYCKNEARLSFFNISEYGVHGLLSQLIESYMYLTTLTEKNCVLLNSGQEFLEEDWLLLSFYICLHRQLSSA